MANLQKIIKVTQEQYDILASGGTVGEYTGLNENYIYLVQRDSSDSSVVFIVLDAEDATPYGETQMQWELTEDQYNLAIDDTRDVHIILTSTPAPGSSGFFDLRRSAKMDDVVDFLTFLPDNEVYAPGLNGILYEGQVVENSGSYYFRIPSKMISVLTTGSQNLSADQKAQVKSNLGLAEVASSGDYEDLINVPQVQRYI